MAFTIERITATENDIGGSQKGRVMTEDNWESCFAALNYPVSGLAVSDGGSGVASVALGAAIILGHYVNLSAGDTIDLFGGVAPNGDDYYDVFLQLTDDGGGDVNGAQLVKVVDNSIPSKSILLAEVRVSGGSITHTFDRRTPGEPWKIEGPYDTTVATPNSANGVHCGFRPSMVLAAGGGGTVLETDIGPGLTGGAAGTITIENWGFTVGGAIDAASSNFLAFR